MFYLSLDEYGDAAQRAAHADSESLPVFGGGARDIELTPWEMAQARYIDESAALAQLVEAALRERVPVSSRALQQAPLRVLVGANMPAVLVEMGFVTNAEQEKQLRSDDFQNTVVQALVGSITRFRDARSATHPAPTGAGALMAPTRRRSCPDSSSSCRSRPWRRSWAIARRWYAALRPAPRGDRLPACGAGDAPSGRSRRRSISSPRTACRWSATEREIPFAEPIVVQARRIVEAQLGAAPAPLASAIPPGTTLRDAVHHRTR